MITAEVIPARRNSCRRPAGTLEIHPIVVNSTEFYVVNITTTAVRTHTMEWERNSVIMSD